MVLKVKAAPSGQSTPADPADCHDDWIDEWKSCRTDLARFDGYLDTLRKQGFSYVATLLSATTLLGYVAGTVVTPPVKAAILIVTQGLIVAVAFLEKEYRLMGEATATRARILERQLNLAESDTITVVSEAARLWVTDLILNVGFIVLTLALGCALLSPIGGLTLLGLIQSWPLNAVTAASIVATFLVLWSSHRQLSRMLDLEVDRVKAISGDSVKFTIYSLYPTSRMPALNWLLGGWKGRKRSRYRLELVLIGVRAPTVRLPGSKHVHADSTPSSIEYRFCLSMHYLESYEIEWDTEGLPAGVYQWSLAWKSPEWTDSKSPWRHHAGLDRHWVGSAEHVPLGAVVEVLEGPDTPETGRVDCPHPE